MTFPIERGEQYVRCAQIIGDTVETIGGEVDTVLAGRWQDTMRRLAYADDVSETQPEVFADPISLVAYLEVEESAVLIGAASRLLTANNESVHAPTISAHFSARKAEAVSCVDLLRYQSPEPLRGHEYVWQQIGSVSGVGIFVDSLIDAAEDARRLPQFSASQLRRGAYRAIAREAPAVDRKTWMAVGRAAQRQNLPARVASKFYRAL